MNQKFTHLFFTVFAFCAMLVYSAQAQENPPAGDPAEVDIKELNSHPELNLNEDKTLLLESTEHQKPHGVVVTREQAVAKPSKAKAEKPADKEEEEDALSFNFLYYIISKFKYSDIVD
ncbi:MAG: hypothetical protein HOP30_12405 [Cyclobacteriaceae bacterium]|nr:hypothetical protein [Cyclobacteriaceae bacterium]